VRLDFYFSSLDANRSSFRTRRRSHASNISSDVDGHQTNTGSSTTDPTDENRNNITDEFDIINTRPFPWIKVVIRIFNNINLTSDHQIKHLSNSYDKQIKSCKNLLKALVNMYQLSSSYSCPSSIQTHLTPNKKKGVKKVFEILLDV